MLLVTNNEDNRRGKPLIKGSLRYALAQAKPGEKITFASNLAKKTISLEQNLKIDQDVIIDGANAKDLTISGVNEHIVFNVTKAGTQFTLRNLTITDAFHRYAGAGIRVTAPKVKVNVENSQFHDNTAGQGAAIWAKDGAKVTVLNSEFTGNKATERSDSTGGAISVFKQSQLTVKGSKFTGNEGETSGAIVTIFTPVTIEDSIFTDNFGRRAGGAVHFDGASIPSKGIYYKKGKSPRDSKGGNIIIRNSHFENNRTSHLGGGAAVWGYDQDYVLIEDSKFINNRVTENKAKNTVVGGGGARLSGFVTIKDTVFANNQSETNGGGIWYQGAVPVNIIDTTFKGNQAKKLGGAIYNKQWGGKTNIVDSVFADNQADKGRVIYRNKSIPLTIENSSFDDNKPNNFNSSKRLTIKSSTFDKGGVANENSDTADAPTQTSNDALIKGTKRSDNLSGGDGDQTIKGYSGDDTLEGGKGNDQVIGDGGRDLLIGVDAKNSIAGRGEIDILKGGGSADVFQLGNKSTVYYNDGKGNNPGWSDYGLVKDFNLRQKDVIQLHGKSNQYRLQAAPEGLPKGTAIFLKTSGQDELVGIVHNVNNLELDSSAFEFT